MTCENSDLNLVRYEGSTVRIRLRLVVWGFLPAMPASKAPWQSEPPNLAHIVSPNALMPEQVSLHPRDSN